MNIVNVAIFIFHVPAPRLKTNPCFTKQTMFHFRHITALHRCLFFIITTTALTVTITLAQQPGKQDYLFIQSVRKCLSRGSHPPHRYDTGAVVSPSGAPQTLPRDCKSVFRHFLMNYRSYVSLTPPRLRSQIIDVTSPDRILTFNPHAPPLDLSHIFLTYKDDLREFRTTNMWGTFNNALRRAEENNGLRQPHKTKAVNGLNPKGDSETDSGFWEGLLLKRSNAASNGLSNIHGNIRRRRLVGGEALLGAVGSGSGSSRGLAPKRKGAQTVKGLAAPQQKKRAYDSWYDVIRQRRQQVLSVNNALATLSDMLMEHHRNRVMRNRERLRYYMMMQG
ncbi:hypothetical protein Btru_063301 [Bulinus truncatus]|nr:hypothetical protein Btru_063301 [Bulinus truncatus]